MRVIANCIDIDYNQRFTLNIAPTAYTHTPDVHASIHIASAAAC